MKEIITDHIKRYPLMEAKDLVKLIYQSEFGGGHMITDRRNSFMRLCDEYNSISHMALCQNPRRPGTEDIGGGIIRVDLHSFNTNIYSLSMLNDIFVDSASLIKGSKSRFEDKLYLLIEMSSDGLLPVSHEKLTNYLDFYKKDGYPAVSHSEIYKKAYDPAYRVVCRDLFDKYFN